MKRVYIFIGIYMTVVSAFCVEITDPRLAPTERAESLASEVILQQIGFPFDNPKRLAQSLETIRMAEILVEWSRLREEDRSARMEEIIHASRGKNRRFALARINLNTLKNVLPSEQAERLMAAFVWMGHRGRIMNMDVLLEFSLVYLGNAAEAEEMKNAMPGTVLASPVTLLSSEERLSLWPAAKAIITQATEAVPLLMDAARNPELSKTLRLRAAAFLREIAPESLSEEFIVTQEKEIAEAIRCIVRYEVSWKGMAPDVCGHYGRGKKR